MIKKEVLDVIEGLVKDLNLPADAKSASVKVEDIVFGRSEVYDTATMRVWAFRNRGDYRYDDNGNKIVLDLGNMLNEPVEVNGVMFANSECLYISGLYSDGSFQSTHVQNILAKHRNGLFAKKMFRYRTNEYCQFKRSDWTTFNLEWMKWVIKMKIESNPQFRQLLLNIPDDVMLVEDVSFQPATSTTRLFWGAENPTLKKIKKDLLKKLKKILKDKGIKYRKEDGKYLYNSIYNIRTYQGINMMGKILTYMMLCLKNGEEPVIDYDFLNNKDIWLCGKKLVF